jgi:hypothetical protein
MAADYGHFEDGSSAAGAGWKAALRHQRHNSVGLN